MVGAGVLLECLDAPAVSTVLVIGRQSCGITHPKLTERIQADMFDLSAVRDALAGRDACFFCLGVSAVGLNETTYTHLTYDLTLAVANALFAVAPRSVFVYVSGQGTDSSEHGRSMWARVKGRTENALLGLGFPGAYMFRPGFIQPLRGVRSRTSWYQLIYSIVGPIAPLVRKLAPNSMTTTVNIGRAMIAVVTVGFDKPVLTTRDINRVAAENP
jgi:uncharacterized protein YbjT (DUF2867 family)